MKIMSRFRQRAGFILPAVILCVLISFAAEGKIQVAGRTCPVSSQEDLFRALQTSEDVKLFLEKDIILDRSVAVDKTVEIVSDKEQCIRLKAGFGIAVQAGGCLKVDQRIRITGNRTEKGILYVQNGGRLECSGQIENTGKRGIGLEGTGKQAQIVLNKGGKICRNASCGIRMNGGRLYVNGGSISQNGTAGSRTERGSRGGGVLLRESAGMKMTSGNISDNKASLGGGIYVSENSVLQLTGGVIGQKPDDENGRTDFSHGNFASESHTRQTGGKYTDGSGGGIYSQGRVIVDGRKRPVAISGNKVRGIAGGGGILIRSGSLYIFGQVSFRNNRASSSNAKDLQMARDPGDANAEGAAIRLGDEYTDTAVRCLIGINEKGKKVPGKIEFTGNRASGDGGALMVSQTDMVTCQICGQTENEEPEIVFSDNRSECNGGGAVKSTGGRLRISGAEFVKNRSDGSGGGVASTSAHTVIENCRFRNNRASGDGGAVYLYKSKAGKVASSDVKETVFEGNSATRGGGMWNGGKLRVSSVKFSENTARKGHGMYLGGKENAQCECTGKLSFDTSDDIFLGEQQIIYFSGSKENILKRKAILNLEKKERRPGRILLKMTGNGQAADLCDEDGQSEYFAMAFRKNRTGYGAEIRAGNRLTQKETGDRNLNQDVLYLSEKYPVIYQKNLPAMTQNPKENEVSVPHNCYKYWKEKLNIPTPDPVIAERLKGKNRFLGWYAKEDHIHIRQNSYIYEKDRKLTLKAEWKREPEYELASGKSEAAGVRFISSEYLDSFFRSHHADTDSVWSREADREKLRQVLKQSEEIQQRPQYEYEFNEQEARNFRQKTAKKY